MQRLSFLIAILLTLALVACEAGGIAPGGATPGGVQDIGTARELIANGVVPLPEAFTVEGMFSEYDLPLEGDACELLLCLRGALGIAPTLDDESAAWLQIGLSSSESLETLKRPSLSAIFVVDVSGSMSAGYSSSGQERYQTPLELSQSLMRELIPTLNQGDEVAIVIYGSQASVHLPFTQGDSQERLVASVRALESGGSTFMEEGLQRAYQLMDSAADTQEKRLFLFTDVQPNVGATSASEFETLVSEGAAQGVGLSVFGVGVGLGPETFDAMSKTRGGNAFTLFDGQDIEKIMQDDWPYLASPIAYDLTLSLDSQDVAVAKAYGFPSSDKAAQLEAKSVFLSKRRGALLVQLEPQTQLQAFSADASLTYTTRDEQTITEDLALSYTGEALDERGHYYQQASVAKTVSLALLVSEMREAAELYGEDSQTAIALLEKLVSRFEADIEATAATDLQKELELVQALLKLMEEGAEQGTLYGYGG